MAATGTVKVDWDGLPFEWNDGYVYKTQGLQDICPHLIDKDMANGASNANPYSTNGETSATSCIAEVGDEFPQPYVYEISADGSKWNRHHIANGAYLNGYNGNQAYPVGSVYKTDLSYRDAYGPENGTVYRNRCDVNNNGTWTDDNWSGYCDNNSNDQSGEWEDTGISCSPVTHSGLLPISIGINTVSTVVDGTTVICYAPASGGGGSCNGLTYSSCTTVAGCNWTPSSSSQSRTVLCKDSNGQTVLDSFCSLPKPETTQGCLGGGSTGTPGCYPVEYSEVTVPTAFTAQTCNTWTTESSCMNSTYWWNQSSGTNSTGSGAPVYAAQPSDVEDYAAYSHGDTSGTLIDLSLYSDYPLITGGDALPKLVSEWPSCITNEDCYITLGAVCIWGEQ